VYVFGYGSLSSSGSGPGVSEGVPATLHGWRRDWGVAMDNTRDLPGYKHYLTAAGERPALFVAFLDIRPDARARVNGVAFPVGPRELATLDERERNYERVEVGVGLDLQLDGPVWAYAGRQAARERRQRGLSSGCLAIPRAYHDEVRRGFAVLGPDALSEFDATTAPLPCALVDLRVIRHDPVRAGRP